MQNKKNKFKIIWQIITDKTKRLDPNEMAFRAIYKDLLINEKITKVFRPGQRVCGAYRGYCPHQNVIARIIKNPGADWAGVAPEFIDDFAKKIIIEKVETKKISKLTADDFTGASPDITDQTTLKYHLGLIYNIPAESINDDFDISIIQFKYHQTKKEEKKMNISSLVLNNLIKIAQMPQNNPPDFYPGDCMATLIEHDYPAKTPAMWNAVYRALGFKTDSVMFVASPSNIAEIFQAFREDAGYRGGGLGVGFKDAAIEHLDELDPIAEQIGAVNLVRKTSEGKLRGYNTDGLGYVMSLREKLLSQGKALDQAKALILGAGGTGNAIAFALAEQGVSLVILNRTKEKAQSLAEKINQFFHLSGSVAVRAGGEEQIAEEALKADVIINVSTKGAEGAFADISALASAATPLDQAAIENNLAESRRILETLGKQAIISDVVLRNEPTPLLRQAQELGFEVLNGLPMVVNQAVEAFWLLHADEMQGREEKASLIAELMQQAI